MKTKCILVIDNEEYIGEIAQICLETVAGWKVLTARSGHSGLILAENEQPDAILLDVMMPDMDGPTTFQHLQANPATQDIPVIFLTAKAQAYDRARYASMGVQAAIAKPFNPLELASLVAEALNWKL
ncbi:response regulator [Aetokthonos hydrillicola Thurmond2011]|jgi:CheY-like chemotaxis protein|uniref:Response regulator n=1 Tax=Aetokthonos hydrillicola Thurmond2011 TaxID=2712845 RepID=A0AAP5I2F5_9CYAN|nr:response regulator [Aetokthonos hydrillicola]MBO3458325.1 response regulator [Aetokthonos hydrillicola CCALA 1050]MBW4585888.1 response regulator [Aetokthonos hydrillicola CCALA 1050]MDR9893887.1 response regulator [Aetokthonos hydrillicola Thurmond2011]